MPWHSVVISSPAKLTRANFSLAIEQDAVAKIPFEDIAIIVLNHRAITLTHPVLSACADYGVGLFSTGDDFQPNGVFVPFLPHSRTTKIMRQQLATDKPTSKRAWTKLVRAKIDNQALCLDLAGQIGGDYLRAVSKRVRSGDPDNLEAQASAFYFKKLFGDKFKRGHRSKVNASLNYGYAIFRGSIARVLVAHGFLPAFGLHHHNEQNAFNLADDLIEPFRPLVDLFVSVNCSGEEDLTTTDKAALVELLHYDLAIAGGTSSGLVAIDRLITSLVRVVESADGELLEIPKLVALKVHVDEC